MSNNTGACATRVIHPVKPALPPLTLTENHAIRDPNRENKNYIDGELTITKGAAGPGDAGEHGRGTNLCEMRPQIGRYPHAASNVSASGDDEDRQNMAISVVVDENCYSDNGLLCDAVSICCVGCLPSYRECVWEA